MHFTRLDLGNKWFYALVAIDVNYRRMTSLGEITRQRPMHARREIILGNVPPPPYCDSVTAMVHAVRTDDTKVTCAIEMVGVKGPSPSPDSH